MTASEAEVPRTKADRTRSRILDAAAGVFRAHGYNGAGLRDVAAAADMQVGSLYYHFASREALVTELLHVGNQRVTDAVQARLAELPPTSSPLQQFRAVMRGHVGAIVADREYVAAALRLLGAVPPEVHQVQVRDARAYADLWRDLLADAQTAGQIRPSLDLSAMRMFLMGGLNSTPDWYDPARNGLTGAELANEFWVVFVEGLASRRRPVRRARTGIVPKRAVGAPESKAAATRRRILLAAAQCFREQGYEDTSFQDIAEAAGLQRGSLYYHFPSLEQLAEQLLHDAWEHTSGAMRRAVGQLPPAASPLARLEAALSAHLLSLLGEGGETAGLVHVLAQVPQEVRDRSLTFQRSYLTYLRRLAQEAQAAGELRSDIHLPSAVVILLSSLNWSVEWFDPAGPLSPEDLAGQYLTMVLDGLSPARRAGPSS